VTDPSTSSGNKPGGDAHRGASKFFANYANRPPKRYKQRHKTPLAEREVFLLMFRDRLPSPLFEILDRARDMDARHLVGQSHEPWRVCGLSPMVMQDDGPGIPVTKNWPGRKITGYLPEAIMSEERTGSNFDDTERPDRVTGGLNGLGMKITNVGSLLGVPG